MGNTPQDEDWITINQACAVAKVTRSTLYDWIAKDKVQTARTAGGHIRILKSSLIRPPA